MASLKIKDLVALSMMTLALFVGAGNIIFPPYIAIEAGNQVWSATAGFLITAVCLPAITIIAIARNNGGLDVLCKPLGYKASLAFSVACFLTVGPLFAIPRTATVSYEIGIVPFFNDSHVALAVFSFFYFLAVTFIAFNPGKILDTVGKFIAPVKIFALAFICLSTIFYALPALHPPSKAYQISAFGQGFTQGYLTMDTIAAAMYGMVIANTIRYRGVTKLSKIISYSSVAGIAGAIGLTLIYFALFRLGSLINLPAGSVENGAQVLNIYVHQVFGNSGDAVLAALITIACLVTAVGLTSACSAFFSQHTPFSYRQMLFIISFSSLLISNLGLSAIISLSLPVLSALYPPCVCLILLSFFNKYWRNASRVVAPVAVVTFVFGILEAISHEIGENHELSHWLSQWPLAQQGMIWLLPALVVLFFTIAWDRLTSRQKILPSLSK